MKKELIYALAAYSALLVLSFVMSIMMGYGKAESLHEPASLWMYGRRLLMIVIGIGIPWLRGRDTLAAFGWQLSVTWFFIIVAAGGLIGISNKGGFDPASLIAVILALFHAFATELFFRRYLLRTFSALFTGMWFPVLLSSFLYGLFYLTVWTTWGLPMIGKIIFAFLFTGLGILFSYSYKKSGCFLVPWLMHFLGVLNYRMLF
jgi:hypothetical protein